MTAVRIKEIDNALVARYSGIQIDVDGVPTAVAVFIENPSTEEFTERVYPSIAIKFMSLESDDPRRHSDDELDEEIAYNDVPTPPIRTMRQNGEPFRVLYTLDTWHKVRATESRDLVTEAIIERTPPRGYMNVTDIDSGTTPLWVMWEGNVANLDEDLPDITIYHKSLTISVLARVLTDPNTRDLKVVIEGQWKVFKKGDPDVEDITMSITESGDEEAP
jgi:hypothetical protein